MQRKYKGNIIPTIEEVVAQTEEYRSQGLVTEKLVYPCNGINIELFTDEEAENMTSDEANRKITTVFEEFIDHYLDQAVALVDSAKQMEESVNEDPTKQFKEDPGANTVVLSSNEEEDDEEDEEYVPKEDVIGKSINAYKQLEKLTPQSNITTEEVIKLYETANKVSEETTKPTENHVEPEKGETRKVMMSVDPATGASAVVPTDDNFDDETFEEMYERIKNSDIEFDTSKPITKENVMEFMAENPDLTMISELAAGANISTEAITGLLEVANKRMKKEEFPVYKSLPEEIRKMIDNYADQAGINHLDNNYRTFKNKVAEALIDDFIANVSLDRIQKDFSVEVEEIFNKATEDIGKDIVGYSEEKLNKYREAVEAMEDSEKKDKMKAILSRIEEAYNLTDLKEFSKTCRIKRFELEKPSKIYDQLMNKYSDSPYKIYDIGMARQILIRLLNRDAAKYSERDMDAFFIAFCKQTLNMRPDNVLEHSYMYYVMYNIVLADVNKSPETIAISDKFIDNIKECIANLSKRNPSVL